MMTLSDKPGITLLKSGSFKLNDLSKLLEVDGLKSEMAEVAVTKKLKCINDWSLYYGTRR
jgi:hypothetical protein